MTLDAAGKEPIQFPAQCQCGHLYMERYVFQQPTDRGVIAFAWCGFCRTRYEIFSKTLSAQEEA